MSKSWFTLGGSVAFLLAIVAIYLNTEQQRTGQQFQTSLQSLSPVVMASTSSIISIATVSIAADDDRWAMPSHQEQIAAWQDQQTDVTLAEADLAIQPSSSVDENGQLALSDIDGLVQSKPHFIEHLKQGLANLSDRPESQRGLRPILRSPFSGVSFQPSDRASIERYANRQHLSEGTTELKFLDTGTIEPLLSFRRVLIEDIADADQSLVCHSKENAATGKEQQICLEVAPGGGRYWLEDPNAAWW